MLSLYDALIHPVFSPFPTPNFKAHCSILMPIQKPDGFEAIFTLYREALYQYTFRILLNDADAQDIIQELFTDLWEKRGSLQIHTHIRIYLFNAVRKLILRKFRDGELKEKHPEMFVLNGDPYYELTLSTIIHENILSLLQEDLQHLPEKERQVFTWYHIDELSIREITIRKGTTEQTVRNQLNNAYRKAQGIISKLI
ncbi:RNA polymerase sigma-70 factor, ECF subfamily [Chitinophaga sp. YR573]|nr:RNA polymerase sigma-70 factor, ECF subfamily [Chitinophaga sp. YR573]